MVVDADGSNGRVLTRSSVDTFAPSWSPDGTDIGYLTGDGELKLIARDGSNQRVIVSDGASGSEDPLYRLSWSPDGSRIAYARSHESCTSIVVVSPDGTEPRRITNLPGNSGHPSWSPDGELIMFTHSPIVGFSQIYIVDAHRGSDIGLDDDCAEGIRYRPNPDIAVLDDRWLDIPDATVPASSDSCLPPRQSHYTSVGFPRPERAPSVGKLRIAVLFVDFPDARAPYSTQEETDRLDSFPSDGSLYYGNLATVEKYLETASYGKLDVELIPLRRWLRTRHNLVEFLYDPNAFFYGGAISHHISAEAIELADDTVDVSEVDVIVTVLPSSYFRGGRAQGAVQADGRIIPTLQVNVIPRGRPSSNMPQAWGHTTAHEIAHILGLTDLYPTQQGGYQGEFPIPPAPADMGWVHVETGLMGLEGHYLAPQTATKGIDSTRALEMLAWSRWQLGWLEPTQIRCVTEPSATVTLSPVTDPGTGVVMAAVPTSDTHLIVIESRRDRGYDGGQLTTYDRTPQHNEGVFVYTVDSSLTELPIKFATDDGDGQLDQSPTLPLGGTLNIKGYKITVIADDGNTHTVQITNTTSSR